MTTPEEARQLQIADCDAILSAPWVVARIIGAEGRRRANANRNYWQQASEDECRKYAAFLDNEPRRQEAKFEEQCPKCGRYLTLCLGCVECGHVEAITPEETKEGEK